MFFVFFTCPNFFILFYFLTPTLLSHTHTHTVADTQKDRKSWVQEIKKCAGVSVQKGVEGPGLLTPLASMDSGNLPEVSSSASAKPASDPTKEQRANSLTATNSLNSSPATNNSATTAATATSSNNTTNHNSNTNPHDEAGLAQRYLGQAKVYRAALVRVAKENVRKHQNELAYWKEILEELQAEDPIEDSRDPLAGLDHNGFETIGSNETTGKNSSNKNGSHEDEDNDGDAFESQDLHNHDSDDSGPGEKNTFTEVRI